MKNNKIDFMLDNAIRGIENTSNAYSRLDKIMQLMPLIKSKSELVKNNPLSHDSVIYCDGFLDGYENKIKNIWHNVKIMPKDNEMLICETRFGPLICGPNNNNFSETVKQFEIKRYLYFKDLILI